MSRFRREILNAALLVVAVFSAAMGIKGFLLSSHFIDGGITGVSMLVSSIAGVPLYVLLPVINVPFIMLGYRQMGWAFALRSALGIAGLAVVLAFVPFPDVTPDLLLTAVFGGLFLGAGIGIAIRAGAVLDGTEIAALLISRRLSAFRVGDVILGFNAVLFLCAMLYLGVEEALYSVLVYFAASRTLDFVISGVDEYTAITIVSDCSAPIREGILCGLGRGATIFRGRGGMSGADRDILYCVVTRLEIGKVRAIVEEHDPEAFVVVQSLGDVHGGRVRRPPHP
jgi:uncharacterized membrane-anchored protein YitT (DUF2179 family)